MEETVSDMPLWKLIYDKFLTIDVFMYVDREKVLKFMFAVNKEARRFLQKYFNNIQNGFVNEGLITYKLS